MFVRITIASASATPSATPSATGTLTVFPALFFVVFVFPIFCCFGRLGRFGGVSFVVFLTRISGAVPDDGGDRLLPYFLRR